MKKENQADSMEDLLKKAPAKKPKIEVHNRIKDILLEKRMTQSELADLSDMYPAHLSEIINHTRKGLSVPVALKISKALEMTIEEVFYLPTDQA